MNKGQRSEVRVGVHAAFEVGGREKEGQKLRRLEGEKMWAFGLWRLEAEKIRGLVRQTNGG
jgi:hypothetical protein